MKELRDITHHVSIFFIKVPPQPPDDEESSGMDVTDDSVFPPTSPGDEINNSIHSDSHMDRDPHYRDINNSQDSGLDNSNELEKERSRHALYFSDKEADSLNLFQQLVSLGYLSMLPSGDRQPGIHTLSSSTDSYNCYDSELVENFENFGNIVQFTRQVLRTYLLQTISLLNLVHTRCLQSFIMRAFDMARDMQITPRKLEFAKKKEIELYSTLMDIAVKKQDEIKRNQEFLP